MLSPEYLDGIAESIKAIFSELETKILSDIARRISGADFQMTPSAEFQIYKLQQIGASSKYVRQQIAKYLNISEKELNKIFKEAAIKSIQPDVLLQKAMIDAGMLPKDTIPLTASPAITQTLIADLQRTKNTMKKMTGTIAIDSTGLINKYLDQAQLMVQSGAFTKEKAIETAVNNLARENIQVMDYTSNSRISIEAGVRRAVITGVNQATSKISESNAETLGTDLVQVTSHANARPEHAKFQGKIFSRSGNSKKYKKLSDPINKGGTGYGTVTGLCGANCRHSFYAYVLGISEKVPKEKYDKDRYKNEQIQRYNERRIRMWKQRAAVLDSGSADASKANNKVKEWQSIQRNHINKNGLRRDYAREKVTT